MAAVSRYLMAWVAMTLPPWLSCPAVTALPGSPGGGSRKAGIIPRAGAARGPDDAAVADFEGVAIQRIDIGGVVGDHHELEIVARLQCQQFGTHTPAQR